MRYSKITLSSQAKKKEVEWKKVTLRDILPEVEYV